MCGGLSRFSFWNCCHFWKLPESSNHKTGKFLRTTNDRHHSSSMITLRHSKLDYVAYDVCLVCYLLDAAVPVDLDCQFALVGAPSPSSSATRHHSLRAGTMKPTMEQKLFYCANTKKSYHHSKIRLLKLVEISRLSCRSLLNPFIQTTVAPLPR